jgi:hypothetical protein
MESMDDILEDARRLHDESIRLLAGVIAGKVVPADGHTKEEIIEVLKQDIIGTRKMLKYYGWRDDADRT